MFTYIQLISRGRVLLNIRVYLKLLWQVALFGLLSIMLPAVVCAQQHSVLERVETLVLKPYYYVWVHADVPVEYWHINPQAKKNRIKIILPKQRVGSKQPRWLEKAGEDGIVAVSFSQSRKGAEVIVNLAPDLPKMRFSSANRTEKGVLIVFVAQGDGELATESSVHPEAAFEAAGTAKLHSSEPVVVAASRELKPSAELVASKNQRRVKYKPGPFKKLDKWRPLVEVVIKPGTERSFIESELQWPVWQAKQSMVFLNLRLQSSDENTDEINLGAAYRTIINDSSILGAYVLLDRFDSELGNEYDQITLGFEYLGRLFDVRTNVYDPDNDINLVSTTPVNPGTNSILFSGDDIQVQHSGETNLVVNETALAGFDVEFAYHLPQAFSVFEDSRVAVSTFKFDESGYSDIKGTRVRYETIAYDVDWLGQDSRMTLGLDWQDDDVRDSEFFLHARLTIPIGKSSSRSNANENSTRLFRRMQDRLVRDIDVVSQTKSEEVALDPVVEDALDPASGSRLRDTLIFAEADASGSGTISDPARLDTAIAAATTNGQMVVVSGDNGAIVVVPTASCPANPLCGTAARGNMNVVAGVSVMGGGISGLQATTASGYTVSYSLPGSQPTLQWNDNGAAGAAEAFFNLASNAQLQNFILTGSNQGGAASVTIAASATNVALTNITFNNTIFLGVRVNNDASYTINDVAFQTPDSVTLGAFTGLSAGNNNTAVINNLDINAAGSLTASGMTVDSGGNFTIQNSTFDAGVGVQITAGSPTFSLSNSNLDSLGGGFGMVLIGGGNYQLNNNTFDSESAIAIVGSSPTLSGTGNIFGGVTLCNNAGTPTGSVTFDTGTCP